jgi:hypothetical protein
LKNAVLLAVLAQCEYRAILSACVCAKILNVERFSTRRRHTRELCNALESWGSRVQNASRRFFCGVDVGNVTVDGAHGSPRVVRHESEGQEVDS